MVCISEKSSFNTKSASGVRLHIHTIRYRTHACASRTIGKDQDVHKMDVTCSNDGCKMGAIAFSWSRVTSARLCKSNFIDKLLASTQAGANYQTVTSWPGALKYSYTHPQVAWLLGPAAFCADLPTPVVHLQHTSVILLPCRKSKKLDVAEN